MLAFSVTLSKGVGFVYTIDLYKQNEQTDCLVDAVLTHLGALHDNVS